MSPRPPPTVAILPNATRASKERRERGRFARLCARAFWLLKAGKQPTNNTDAFLCFAFELLVCEVACFGLKKRRQKPRASGSRFLVAHHEEIYI